MQWLFMKESQTEANLAGDKMYDNKKPCKNGHLSPRYTSNAACLECLKERKAKMKASFGSQRKVVE